MQAGKIPRAATLVVAIAFSIAAIAQNEPASNASTNSQLEATAKEAYLYGLPMVMLYRIMYDYAVNENSSQFKAPFNTIANVPRVYTPADTSVVTPNSDTPYSFLWMDLRAEPLVLCVPEIEA